MCSILDMLLSRHSDCHLEVSKQPILQTLLFFVSWILGLTLSYFTSLFLWDISPYNFLTRGTRERFLKIFILPSYFWMGMEMKLEMIFLQKFEDTVSLSYCFYCIFGGVRCHSNSWFWHETCPLHPSGDCRIFSFFSGALKCHDRIQRWSILHHCAGQACPI